MVWGGTHVSQRCVSARLHVRHVGDVMLGGLRRLRWLRLQHSLLLLLRRGVRYTRVLQQLLLASRWRGLEGVTRKPLHILLLLLQLLPSCSTSHAIP